MSFVDKDRPSTWKRYQKELCMSCRANCCCMPVEVKASDLVRLSVVSQDELDQSIKKTAKRLKKEGLIVSYREGTEFFMLAQKANGDCIFLNERTRFCSVYDKRPDTCRQFPDQIGTRVGWCPYEPK